MKLASDLPCEHLSSASGLCPPLLQAQAGLDSAGNGGLLKQGSAAIAGLFKQGSVAAGLPKQGAAVDAPAGGAHPRPAKAPSRAKVGAMLPACLRLPPAPPMLHSQQAVSGVCLLSIGFTG